MDWLDIIPSVRQAREEQVAFEAACSEARAEAARAQAQAAAYRAAGDALVEAVESGASLNVEKAIEKWKAGAA